MTPETEAAIRAEWQAARERPGAAGGPFQVPGDVYADTGRFEREREHVFQRSWLPLCRAAELAEPGAFRTFDLVGSPIVVVRTETGELRAHSNVCGHRGAQVQREPAGTVEAFTCPYHGVRYALDGRCVAWPEPASFGDRPPTDLEPMALETWGGWIWVRRNQAGEALRNFLGEALLSELEAWPFEDVQLQSRETFEAPFDWKIGIEAFLESLHLPAIHARTAHPLLDHRGTAQASLGHHSRMSTPFRSPDAYSKDGPLGAAAHEAGVALFPKLNAVQRTSNFSYLLFPATVLNLLPTHFTLFRILPTAAGHCRFDYELYAAPPTTERARSYVASLGPGYQKLLVEDLDNLAWIQNGLARGDRRELCLSAHERRVLHFRETLGHWMA